MPILARQPLRTFPIQKTLLIRSTVPNRKLLRPEEQYREQSVLLGSLTQKVRGSS